MRFRASALTAAGVVLLAGCASTAAPTTGSSGTPARAAASGDAMAPGMVMPDGSTMGASANAGAPAGRSAPSGPARMICSHEVQADIATILAVKALPAPRARWADPVYTCTYTLPAGTLTLSVTDSPDVAGTRTVVAATRKRLGVAKPVAGLTDVAFATSGGAVTLVKDAHTLLVDATRLPAHFGRQGQQRSAFAYEVASAILGCWTGDE